MRNQWSTLASALGALSIFGALILIPLLQIGSAINQGQTLGLTVAVCLLGLVGTVRMCATADCMQRCLKRRDEVLRSVSHDLANPLHTIQMAALLWRSRESGNAAVCPDVILRAVARMVRLVQDLRDIVSIEAGHALVFNLQNCEVNSILEEVHESSQCLAREKSIHLKSSFTKTPVFVVADRNRLLQVLFNLTDNAIKFTPHAGCIVIDCETQNGYVRFAVRDTGPGIPSKDLDNVFALYWQAAPTAHLGSGLGLATARHIVEQHGGQIWAESNPGKGASFFFTIPAVVP